MNSLNIWPLFSVDIFPILLHFQVCGIPNCFPSSLISGVGFASAGTVLSCAGAPGKVLVPGGGNDDFLSSAELAVDAPEQTEESKVPQSSDVNHVFVNN